MARKQRPFIGAIFLSCLFVLGLSRTEALSTSEQSALKEFATAFSILRTSSPSIPVPWSNTNASLACSAPWTGLVCVSESVRQILLPSFGLVGNVPASISNLTNLIKLDLSENTLGAFPAATLTQLLELDLANNQINSPLSNLGGLTSLQKLDISFNRFSGTLGNLTSLTSLTALGPSSRNSFQIQIHSICLLFLT